MGGYDLLSLRQGPEFAGNCVDTRNESEQLFYYTASILGRR